MKRFFSLSALGAVGLGIALFPAAGALAAPAARTAGGPVAYRGTAHSAARLAPPSAGLFHRSAVTPRLAAASPARRAVTYRSPNGSDPAASGARAQAARISASGPAAASLTVKGAESAPVRHSFNGLSNADQAAVNGGPDVGYVTPPDQGLCVGPVKGLNGGHDVVVEAINSALRLTGVKGTRLTPDIALSTLFADPYALGDVRCLYDRSRHSFYFTEIGFPVSTGPNKYLTNTTVDVTVLNAAGAASYQFDSSLGGQCLGDQPKTGFTSRALVVSTDEYCGSKLNNYRGAIVLSVSKRELVALAPAVTGEQFGPVSLAGIPGLGLDPAINTRCPTGYLVNSFPFDAAGNNNEVSSSLGLWRVRGHTLTGRVIHSETYAFPVPAASTGDGSITSGITSEAYLNPDDSRLSGPVNVTRTSSGDVRLWTALDSAVSPRGDPTARDGAAWFEVDTGRRQVVRQGFVAAAGDYLLYPALQKPARGPADMVFTITSHTINPSSAYNTLGSGGIRVVAAGTGPHLSWSDVKYGSGRWGDYSFTALSPGHPAGVWMATEYIPPVASQNYYDNWGTSVFEVSG